MHKIQYLNKVMGKGECYKGDFLVNDTMLARKNFFPSHWTQEEVINRIVEAYENFMQSGQQPFLEKGGKYRINSFTNDGIAIEIYIRADTITVAYPRF
ncbi:MAG TPA: EndoU domain-containing protein [Candidatus Babeliales bacterium]|nr:EndoU domain-containing protein [Candidatus Babeliales bacterium]